MVTTEQKEKNKQYVLSHFEEYVLDSHGNFVNVAPDTEGEEWYFTFGEHNFTPEGYREIKTKMFEMILQEIKDWELDYYEDNITHFRDPIYFKHRKSGRKMNKHGFSFEQSYQIIGELGYRENIWEKYEETIKNWEENERKYGGQFQQNPTPFSNSPNPNPNQPPHSKTNPEIPNQNPILKQPPKPNQKQDNPPPPSNQENNTPSSTNIQNQYNSGKDKSEIENSYQLTTSKQKESTQELLKLIITAELLIKEQKSNPEILSQLSKEKEQNTLAYQSLNKEGRISKVINGLVSIQKSQKNNNKLAGNHQPPPLSLLPKLLISGTIVGVIIIGLGTIILIRKRRGKKS